MHLTRPLVGPFLHQVRLQSRLSRYFDAVHTCLQPLLSSTKIVIDIVMVEKTEEDRESREVKLEQELLECAARLQMASNHHRKEDVGLFRAMN